GRGRVAASRDRWAPSGGGAGQGRGEGDHMKSWTKLGILLIAAGIASLVTLVGSAGARSTPRTNDDLTTIAAADDYAAAQFPALGGAHALLNTLADCSSGAHSLSHFGDRVYPEMVICSSTPLP